MKKAIALFVSTVIFCAALAGCGGSGNSQASPSQSGSQQETVASESGGNARVLQIGHVNPGKDNDQYHTLCTLFGEKLTALSGGAFEIDILSDSLLGGERDMMEGMKIGTVDMAIITNLYYGNFVQDFTVFDLPYIFANRDEAYSILDDGNIMDPLTENCTTTATRWQSDARRQRWSTQPNWKDTTFCSAADAPADARNEARRTPRLKIILQRSSQVCSFPLS